MHRSAATALLGVTALATTLTGVAHGASTPNDATPSGATSVLTAPSFEYSVLQPAEGSSATYGVDLVTNPGPQTVTSYDPQPTNTRVRPALDVVAPSGAVSTMSIPAGLVTVSESMVVVNRQDDPFAHGPAVTWFDLAKGTSGTGVPAPQATQGFVVAASRDGWLTVDTESSDPVRVFDTTTDGTVTPFGTPFADLQDWTELDLVPGPAGILADDEQGHVAYMSYSDPGSWTPLDTGTDQTVVCSSVTSEVAGCAAGKVLTNSDEYQLEISSILQLPLDGRAVVTTDLPCKLTGAESPVLNGPATADLPVLDSSAAVWVNPCPDKRGSLASTPLLQDKVSTSSITPTDHALSGYQDEVFYADSPSPAEGPAKVSAVTDANSKPQLVEASKHAAAEASAVSLTVGRVAWQSNETDRYPVSDRDVALSPAVSVGPEKTVASPGGLVQAEALRVSGARTAYTRPHGKTSIVGAPGKTTHVSHAVAIALSGDRLLTSKKVVDLRTGKSVTPKLRGPAPTGGSLRVIAMSLWGNTLAFAETDGGVWVKDLATGKETRVNSVNANGHPVPTGSVSVYGDYVGWAFPKTIGKNGTPAQAAYRDFTTMSPAVAVTGVNVPSGVTLTSDGVMTQTEEGEWLLTPYRGGDVVDLGSDLLEPQVESSVLAYVDPTGAPLVAALPTAVVNQPRSLGDSIAPKHFTAKPGHKWTSYQPFSAALTRCKVAIRHKGHAVAHLSCKAADMKLGDVLVHWNGKNDAGHRVRAGHYSWRTKVSNSAGSGLKSGGAAQPLTGTIAVHRH